MILPESTPDCWLLCHCLGTWHQQKIPVYLLKEAVAQTTKLPVILDPPQRAEQDEF